MPLPALQPADALDGPPIVTARAWAVADGRTGKLLWARQGDEVLEMASTTKIMTAWIVFELAKDHADLLDEPLHVSEAADDTGGSTAEIRRGETYAVRDVLFGLLLPSGNDAAMALAEHVGGRLPPVAPAEGKPGTQKATNGAPDPGGAPRNGSRSKGDEALARFVQEMNRRAARLEMKGTTYLDPHGNSRNRSTAADLLKLTFVTLQNADFAKCVATREHVGRARLPDGRMREVRWRNTNQLLDISGYDGVKTGTTGGAGACLVSSAVRGDQRQLLVVLGAAPNPARFVDSRNLHRWAWQQRAADASATGATK
jgi:D-alanyl-D-alanine carboxypeptidase (penicillin-binding protein 5/6)